jgi:hypothetical protein
MRLRGQQRDGESAEQYAARAYRGYKIGGMGLLVLGGIMWVFAVVRPSYRGATILAGFVWFALGLAFIKVSNMPPDDGVPPPRGPRAS